MNPYEVLGVGKKADEKEIKNAYRKKARDTHPDKGGKEEEFALVNAAYSILSDSTARRRYDKTGDTAGMGDVERRAMNDLTALFLTIVDSSGEMASTVDLMKIMGDQITEHIDDLKLNIEKSKRKCKNLQGIRKRLKRKKKGSGFFEVALDERIEKTQLHQDKIKHDIKVTRKMLVLLKEYSFEHDEEGEQNSFFMRINQYGGRTMPPSGFQGVFDL